MEREGAMKGVENEVGLVEEHWRRRDEVREVIRGGRGKMSLKK